MRLTNVLVISIHITVSKQSNKGIFMAAHSNWHAIIFCSCGFYLSSFFLLFSSPNLSGREIGCLPYFHTTSYDLSANLECMSEMCCTRLAEIQDEKITPKIAIWAPLHNFVGLYLCKYGTYRQSENIVKCQYLHMSSQNGELRPTNG